MRLENKMYKLFKFLIKLMPFYFVVFSFVNVLFNETIQFDINTILTDSFTNNYFVTCVTRLLDNNNISFVAFNRKLFNILTGTNWNASAFTNAWSLFNFVVTSIEWFIFVDLFDLIFSAFRFIINIAHSWIDSFYERGKRGGKQ